MVVRILLAALLMVLPLAAHAGTDLSTQNIINFAEIQSDIGAAVFDDGGDGDDGAYQEFEIARLRGVCSDDDSACDEDSDCTGAATCKNWLLACGTFSTGDTTPIEFAQDAGCYVGSLDNDGDRSIAWADWYEASNDGNGGDDRKRDLGLAIINIDNDNDQPADDHDIPVAVVCYTDADNSNYGTCTWASIADGSTDYQLTVTPTYAAEGDLVSYNGSTNYWVAGFDSEWVFNAATTEEVDAEGLGLPGAEDDRFAIAYCDQGDGDELHVLACDVIKDDDGGGHFACGGEYDNAGTPNGVRHLSIASVGERSSGDEYFVVSYISDDLSGLGLQINYGDTDIFEVEDDGTACGVSNDCDLSVSAGSGLFGANTAMEVEQSDVCAPHTDQTGGDGTNKGFILVYASIDDATYDDAVYVEPCNLDDSPLDTGCSTSTTPVGTYDLVMLQDEHVSAGTNDPSQPSCEFVDNTHFVVTWYGDTSASAPVYASMCEVVDWSYVGNDSNDAITCNPMQRTIWKDVMIGVDKREGDIGIIRGYGTDTVDLAQIAIGAADNNAYATTMRVHPSVPDGTRLLVTGFEWGQADTTYAPWTSSAGTATIVSGSCSEDPHTTCAYDADCSETCVTTDAFAPDSTQSNDFMLEFDIASGSTAERCYAIPESDSLTMSLTLGRFGLCGNGDACASDADCSGTCVITASPDQYCEGGIDDGDPCPFYCDKAYEEGTATSATSTTLTDSGASFPDYSSGYSIRVRDQWGEVEYQDIASNTGTEITVTGWTNGTPSSGDSYRIFKPADHDVSCTGDGDDGVCSGGATCEPNDCRGGVCTSSRQIVSLKSGGVDMGSVWYDFSGPSIYSTFGPMRYECEDSFNTHTPCDPKDEEYEDRAVCTGEGFVGDSAGATHCMIATYGSSSLHAGWGSDNVAKHNGIGLVYESGTVADPYGVDFSIYARGNQLAGGVRKQGTCSGGDNAGYACSKVSDCSAGGGSCAAGPTAINPIDEVCIGVNRSEGGALQVFFDDVILTTGTGGNTYTRVEDLHPMDVDGANCSLGTPIGCTAAESQDCVDDSDAGGAIDDATTRLRHATASVHYCEFDVDDPATLASGEAFGVGVGIHSVGREQSAQSSYESYVSFGIQSGASDHESPAGLSDYSTTSGTSWHSLYYGILNNDPDDFSAWDETAIDAMEVVMRRDGSSQTLHDTDVIAEIEISLPALDYKITLKDVNDDDGDDDLTDGDPITVCVVDDSRMNMSQVWSAITPELLQVDNLYECARGGAIIGDYAQTLCVGGADAGKVCTVNGDCASDLCSTNWEELLSGGSTGPWSCHQAWRGTLGAACDWVFVESAWVNDYNRIVQATRDGTCFQQVCSDDNAEACGQDTDCTNYPSATCVAGPQDGGDCYMEDGHDDLESYAIGYGDARIKMYCAKGDEFRDTCIDNAGTPDITPRCFGGTDDGDACSVWSDCTGGRTCDGGTRDGSACWSQLDCPSGKCVLCSRYCIGDPQNVEDYCGPVESYTDLVEWCVPGEKDTAHGCSPGICMQRTSTQFNKKWLRSMLQEVDDRWANDSSCPDDPCYTDNVNPILILPWKTIGESMTDKDEHKCWGAVADDLLYMGKWAKEISDEYGADLSSGSVDWIDFNAQLFQVCDDNDVAACLADGVHLSGSGLTNYHGDTPSIHGATAVAMQMRACLEGSCSDNNCKCENDIEVEISEDCSGTFADDFFNLSTSTWDYDGSGDCETGSEIGVAVHEYPTATREQYVASKLTGAAATFYPGLAFRTPSTDSGDTYHVVLYNSGTDDYEIVYCTGAGSCSYMTGGTCADTTGGIGAMEVGDSMGIEVTGETTSMQVKVWRWDSQSPPARGAWGTHDFLWTYTGGGGDCVWTGGTYATEGGKGVGMYDGSSGNWETYDDFMGGDL
jgi:hypothetical protein